MQLRQRIYKYLHFTDILKLRTISKEFNLLYKIHESSNTEFNILRHALEYYLLSPWGLFVRPHQFYRYKDKKYAIFTINIMAANRINYTSYYCCGEYIVINNTSIPVGVWKTNEDYQISFNMRGQFHGLFGRPSDLYIIFDNHQIIDFSEEFTIGGEVLREPPPMQPLLS